MKITTAIGLITTLIFLPVNGICELEGHAAIDDSIGGIRLYHYPKINIPAGWQVDEAAGQENECLVLVRKDEDSKNPKTMIYATAIRKDSSQTSLAAFIKGDIENFKKNNKKGIVKEIAPIRSAKAALKTYTFSYTYDGNHFRQTVSYAEEGGYFLTFTLTGKTESAHQKVLPDFKEILEGYK